MKLKRAVLVSALAGGVLLAMVAMAAGGTRATARGRSDCHRHAPPIVHDGFPEPPVRYSRNGVLDTRLRASVSRVLINRRRVTAMNYEWSFPGPTLVICT
jgi:hypothetical protein